MSSNSEIRKVPDHSDKMFKALAEQAQMANSKALTLSREVENLKGILLKKDKEIEDLNMRLLSTTGGTEGET